MGQREKTFPSFVCAAISQRIKYGIPRRKGGKISKSRRKKCIGVREDAKFQGIERRERDRSSSEYAEHKNQSCQVCVCVCVFVC